MLIYRSADGSIKIDVRMGEETVWLTQDQMAALFGKAKSTINEHLKNIFSEGELVADSVIRNFRTTAADGKGYDTNYYNLDVIISVGYRVKSHQGTQFRIWATQVLREYLIKGFALNDERMKSGKSMNYFDELQERIRELDGELSRMQLTEGLAGESRNREKARARVNRLMREVDKCIALLGQPLAAPTTQEAE